MPRPSALPLAVELARLAGEHDRSTFLDRVTDIPASRPTNPLPLERAGVAHQPIELRVRDLIDGPAQLAGVFSLATPLAATRRGVHMSRFVEVAAALMEEEWASLEEAAEFGVRLAADRQETTAAELFLSASTIVWRPAPITKRRSPDPFDVAVRAELRHDEVVVRLRLAAAVMTACPCTAAYSHHTARLDLSDLLGRDLAEDVMAGVLTYTHSQRANVVVEFTAAPGFSFHECLAALEEATTMSRELLKRPDEHELVRRAHLKPQFTEDVVRDIAVALARKAPPAAGKCALQVEARAVESIHAHDVSARFNGLVEEVVELVGP